jgi:hypothetical protein
MQYPKPSQEAMMQARYAGDGRPNYEEAKKFPERYTDFSNEGPEQPTYLYHKDRYSEYRR